MHRLQPWIHGTTAMNKWVAALGTWSCSPRDVGLQPWAHGVAALGTWGCSRAALTTPGGGGEAESPSSGGGGGGGEKSGTLVISKSSKAKEPTASPTQKQTTIGWRKR